MSQNPLNSASASETALVATKPNWLSATDSLMTARTVSLVISRRVTCTGLAMSQNLLNG
jgi:hypothetical protein